MVNRHSGKVSSVDSVKQIFMLKKSRGFMRWLNRFISFRCRCSLQTLPKDHNVTGYNHSRNFANCSGAAV
jgi:hypothetical protein